MCEEHSHFTTEWAKTARYFAATFKMAADHLADWSQRVASEVPGGERRIGKAVQALWLTREEMEHAARLFSNRPDAGGRLEGRRCPSEVPHTAYQYPRKEQMATRLVQP